MSSSHRRSPLLNPSSPPKAKKKNPWNRFYLLEPSSEFRVTEWNPWPVKHFRPNALYRAAEAMIKERNEKNVDSFLNKIVLLPASGGIAEMHGGTTTTDLYSIRSPSRLPVRIHLWQTPGGKVMVRKGIQSLTLAQLINSFEITTSTGLHPFYYFWRSLKMNEKFLNDLEVPNHLKDGFRQRWWSISGFPFFNLPAELREMILEFAMGNIAEPYARIYRPAEYSPLPSPCTNLLLVSRQVRREALPILLSQVTFVFRKHGQIMRFLEQISKPSFHALKSFELRFDHETLLDFFGAQAFRNSPAPGYSSSEYYFIDSLFTDRIKLRHLCLYFPHPRENRNSRRLNRTCQKTVCLWVWAAARRCLRDIPEVDFQGCIKDSQKKEWLDILSLERQGILTNPEEIKKWQVQVWSADPRFCFCRTPCVACGDFDPRD